MQEDSENYDVDDKDEEWEVETIQEIIYLLNYTIEHYNSLVEYNEKENTLYNYINLKNGRNTTLKYKCSLAKYKWIEKWIQKP